MTVVEAIGLGAVVGECAATGNMVEALRTLVFEVKPDDTDKESAREVGRLILQKLTGTRISFFKKT